MLYNWVSAVFVKKLVPVFNIASWWIKYTIQNNASAKEAIINEASVNVMPSFSLYLTILANGRYYSELHMQCLSLKMTMHIWSEKIPQRQTFMINKTTRILVSWQFHLFFFFFQYNLWQIIQLIHCAFCHINWVKLYDFLAINDLWVIDDWV